VSGEKQREPEWQSPPVLNSEIRSHLQSHNVRSSVEVEGVPKLTALVFVDMVRNSKSEGHMQHGTWLEVILEQF